MNTFLHWILVASVLATSCSPTFAAFRNAVAKDPPPVEDFKPVKTDIDSLGETERETTWDRAETEFHFPGESYLESSRWHWPLAESDLVHRFVRLQI